MVRLLCLTLLAALLSPAASAAQSGEAPPGNAGIEEYIETIPNADGMARRVPRPGDAPGGRAPVPLPRSTQKALESMGEDGRLAAEVAGLTAAADETASPRERATRGERQAVLAAVESSDGPVATARRSIVETAGGGLGIVLPALMLASAAMLVLYARHRHRGL